jgi:hypothetical protein
MLSKFRKAVQQAGWSSKTFWNQHGSSRGATDLFENTIRVFKTGKAQTLASPTTTLENFSSWVAHDLQSSGPEFHILLPVRQLYMRF